VHTFGLGGIYLPFETDQHPARLGEVFAPATIERSGR
jgi:hypothetical protein